MLRYLSLVICIFGLLAMNNRSFAQNQVGIYAYPSITGSANPKADKQFYKPLPTYSGGFGVDFIHYMDNKSHRHRMIGGRMAGDIKSRMAIRVGLHYQAINQRWKAEYALNRDQGIYKEHIGKKRLDYLKVLMAAQYIIPISPKLKTKYYGGVQPGYLLKADGGLVSYENRGNADYFDLPLNNNDYYNKFSFDLVAAMGVYYRLTRWWNVTCMGKVDFALTKTEKTNVASNGDKIYGLAPQDGDQSGSRNIMLSLLLGVEYSFHKAAHSRTKF